MPSQQGGAWPFSSSNTVYGSYEGYGALNYGTDTGISGGFKQYLFYFILVVIVFVIILVIIHYTVKPIFKFNPGDKGMIGLPGSNDEKLFWKTDASQPNITDAMSGLGQTSANWSMLLDIQVDDALTNTGKPRVLLARSDESPKDPEKTAYGQTDTIQTLVPRFNIVWYLDPINNDLIISVLTTAIREGDSQNQTFLESARIPNLPVGKAVRIGAMVGQNILEIYVNGTLAKSKSYTNSITSVSGAFFGPSPLITSRTARVRNLRLFVRPLTPAEFRAYGRATDFGRRMMADTCVS